MVDGAVALSASLNVVRVDARSWRSWIAALVSLFATVVVNVFEIESMQMTGNVAENRQAYVDEQIYHMLARG